MTVIRNKKLWILAVALVLLQVAVMGAAFFAPYDPTMQNRDVPLASPTRIHFVDSRGRFHFRPFVCTTVADTARVGSQEYGENCSKDFPIRLLVRGERIRDGKVVQSSWHLFGTDAPARVFLLGTDDYGRDQFSRLLHGGQVSLEAGFVAAGLSLGLGLVFGCLAGYFGSWTDEVIMRAAELFMALPWIYLLFAVRAFLPLNLDSRHAFLLLIVVIGLTGWARPSRLIRGVILSAKERGYVLAARGFGLSRFSIVCRHILPEVLPVAVTQAALLVPQYILAEVTLSFLGLGIGEPQPSWGNMLASLQAYPVFTTHWWMLASGLSLFPIFLLFYWFADSLQKRFQVLDLSR